VADGGPGNPPDPAERISTLMDRPIRAFHPAALAFEGRILLAHAHLLSVPPETESSAAFSGSVWFSSAPSSTGTALQVVQQGDEATVWLQRSALDGTLQVQVAPDPSSPAVGVNLPAVNQTATFAAGQTFTEDQTLTSVTIPTTAGAPNPGEVDVDLTITPIDPPTGLTVYGGPLELRIMAPNSTTPPRIIGVANTPGGIELFFSQPMNPVQASNVHNYTVRATWTSYSGNGFLDSTPLGLLSPDTPLGGVASKPGAKTVPLLSANYDPADSTVTLIPKHSLTISGNGSIVVTPGTPAKTSARFRDGSSPAQGLTDLNGNAIKQGGKPGKFRITVPFGYSSLG
jgi:hypothetical protein